MKKPVDCHQCDQNEYNPKTFESICKLIKQDDKKVKNIENKNGKEII